VILVACLTFGCATGAGVQSTARDEMKEGYRAARRGYWQEALLRFENANRLDPGEVRILNNLAIALEAVGRWEEAAEVYEQARTIDGSDSKLRKNYRLFKEFYEAYVAEKETDTEEVEDSNSDRDQTEKGGSDE
jgi:tetratricopeptide (TPR) repeat protein